MARERVEVDPRQGDLLELLEHTFTEEREYQDVGQTRDSSESR